MRIACLAAMLIGCGSTPSTPLGPLTQRPSGERGEVLRWSVDVPEGAGAHAIGLGVDTDPAKLMGWAKGDRQYRVSATVRLEGPGEGLTRTLVVPVTELKEVGRDTERNTVQVAYEAAGEPLSDGFRRAPAQPIGLWQPTPGRWSLSVSLDPPRGGNKLALYVVRAVRIELAADEGPLPPARWTPLDPLPGRP